MSVDLDESHALAGWCWCGLHWLPGYQVAQTEAWMRHTRESCLSIGPQAHLSGEGEEE